MADPKPKPVHRALAGITLPNGDRVEVGETSDAIPARSLPWLLEQGHIEKVEAE